MQNLAFKLEQQILKNTPVGNNSGHFLIPPKFVVLHLYEIACLFVTALGINPEKGIP